MLKTLFALDPAFLETPQPTTTKQTGKAAQGAEGGAGGGAGASTGGGVGGAGAGESSDNMGTAEGEEKGMGGEVGMGGEEEEDANHDAGLRALLYQLAAMTGEDIFPRSQAPPQYLRYVWRM